MIKSPDEDIAFTVWPKTASAAEVHVFRAWSPKHAAEKRARADWVSGQASCPITYCVRDGVSGTIWEIDVAIASQPTFEAIVARLIEMPAATHVLWGGHALCGDLRLCRVPGDWPVGHRWIALKDVAEGKSADFQERFALPARCEACWTKARFTVILADEGALVGDAHSTPPPATPSVLDEVHDFQRFDHVDLHRTGGALSRELKIVCRCGWSSISLDRDTNEKLAVVAAKGLLQMHVEEAIDRVHRLAVTKVLDRPSPKKSDP